AQLIGTTATSPDHPFKIMKDIEIYDGAPLMPPAGQESLDWIAEFQAGQLDQVTSTHFDQ
ncbi:hypothetical protein M3M33_16285, partial [Loigolactobacillus coryniformis]|uniref:hypothetical protein n=1 Tax=Loigolactobacillus coryniformis TaxID=1610 RepID=UPI00201B2CC7